MTFREGSILKKINDPMVRVLLLIAVWVLAAMMFLTFADVFLRTVFNRPILGAGEIIRFMMGIVVTFSVVYTAYQGAHIGVDFILERFPQKLRKFLDVISWFLMIVLVLPMTWETFILVKDEYEAGLTSETLYIPVSPFIAITAIGFLCLLIVLISQFIVKLKEVVSPWTR